MRDSESASLRNVSQARSQPNCGRMYQQSQRGAVPLRLNSTSESVIGKANSNSDFAIGYLNWTSAAPGPILKTSFTGYRTTRYRRKPPGVRPMAEINATEQKRPSRSIMPADEKLPVGREEAAELLCTDRRGDDDLATTKQLITQPNLQDEVSFLRLPELKSVTGLSKSSLYALIRAKSFP